MLLKEVLLMESVLSVAKQIHSLLEEQRRLEPFFQSL
jgi:hypothetical protein